MSKRGISQRTVTVCNPLPAITQAEVASGAGVYDPRAGQRQAFLIDWTYSSGAEAESVALEPQETRILKSDEASWMYNEKSEEGLVLIDVPAAEFKMSNPKVKQALLAGLHKAKKFYFQNGRERLVKQQALNGYSNEQMEMFKTNKYAPLVVNAYKEEQIDKEIARLTASKTVEKV